MRKLYMESAGDAGAGFMKGMAKAAAYDPDIKKMQAESVKTGFLTGMKDAATEREIENIKRLSDVQRMSQTPSRELMKNLDYLHQVKRHKKKKFPPNKEDFERAKKQYPNKWKKNLK